MNRRKRSSPPPPPPRQDEGGPQRLQKVLAAAGVASRRECEQLIVEGRVEVDRVTVTELGTRVDPAQHQIRVDGTILQASKNLYYLVNKPSGVVSTNSDPEGRPRVIDLAPSDQRLFTVGRLDRTSEGLILLTNDGNLANHLAHPRYGVEKTYHVHVVGKPSPEELEQLSNGVRLAEGLAKVSSVKIKKRQREQTILEIVLNEGRNREIRRLLARIGHKVVRLKRVALGPLRLGDVPSGAYRRLSHQEIGALRQVARRAEIRLQSDATRNKTRAKKHSKQGAASNTATAAAKTRSSTSGELALATQETAGVVIGGEPPAPTTPRPRGRPRGRRPTNRRTANRSGQRRRTKKG